MNFTVPNGIQGKFFPHNNTVYIDGEDILQGVQNQLGTRRRADPRHTRACALATQTNVDLASRSQAFS